LARAAEGFENAMAAGVVEGAINLGNMFREGLGVEKDLQKAALIFEAFAANNEVCKELAEYVRNEISKTAPK
jgi:TPR repeat protein